MDLNVNDRIGMINKLKKEIATDYYIFNDKKKLFISN